MRLPIRQCHALYIQLLSPSAWSFYQSKSNHTGVPLQMLKVWDDYLTGGHCHWFRSAVWSCFSLSSEITAHLSKQTWCWCCGNTLQCFTCWLSNQIQPCCGPHLRPALSASESSDNPFLDRPPSLDEKEKQISNTLTLAWPLFLA